MRTTNSVGPELARRVGAPFYVHESNPGRVSFCQVVRDLRPGDARWFDITCEIPPQPADMARIVQANLRGKTRAPATT